MILVASLWDLSPNFGVIVCVGVEVLRWGDKWESGD